MNLKLPRETNDFLPTLPLSKTRFSQNKSKNFCLSHKNQSPPPPSPSQYQIDHT